MVVPPVTVKDLGMTRRKQENRPLHHVTLIFPVQTTLSMRPLSPWALLRRSLLALLCSRLCVWLVITTTLRFAAPLMRLQVWAFAGITLKTSVQLPIDNASPTNLRTVGFANSNRLVSQYTSSRRQPKRLIPRVSGVAPIPTAFGATHRRAWKVREAARAAARHESFISLASGRAFSVVDASDKFSRASNVSAAATRNSLRAEESLLLGSCSCSMLLDNSRGQSLSCAAMPQEQDWGFAIRPCAQQHVASVGRILERTCFRSTGEPVRARENALSSLGDEARGSQRNS